MNEERRRTRIKLQATSNITAPESVTAIMLIMWDGCRTLQVWCPKLSQRHALSFLDVARHPVGTTLITYLCDELGVSSYEATLSNTEEITTILEDNCISVRTSWSTSFSPRVIATLHLFNMS